MSKKEVIPPDPYASPDGMSPVEMRLQWYMQQIRHEAAAASSQGEKKQLSAMVERIEDMLDEGGHIVYGIGSPGGGDVRSPNQWKELLSKQMGEPPVQGEDEFAEE